MLVKYDDVLAAPTPVLEDYNKCDNHISGFNLRRCVGNSSLLGVGGGSRESG